MDVAYQNMEKSDKNMPEELIKIMCIKISANQPAFLISIRTLSYLSAVYGTRIVDILLTHLQRKRENTEKMQLDPCTTIHILRWRQLDKE